MLESRPNFERKNNTYLFLSDMAEATPTKGSNGSQDVNKEEDTPSLVRIYKNLYNLNLWKIKLTQNHNKK